MLARRCVNLYGVTPSIQQLEDLVTACGDAGVPLVLDHARYGLVVGQAEDGSDLTVAHLLHEIRTRFYNDQDPTNDPELQICPETNVAQDWTLMPQRVEVRTWEQVNPEAATRLLEEAKPEPAEETGPQAVLVIDPSAGPRV